MFRFYRFICMVLLIFLLILINPGHFSTVEAEMEPVYPITANIIGFKYIYKLSGLFSIGDNNDSDFLGSAYDFKEREIYYQLGKDFKRNKINYSLKYDYWPDSNLHDYKYQKGLKIDINFPLDMDHELTLTLFSGRTGRELETRVKCDYINLDYYQVLYYDWDQESKMLLKVNTGRARKTGDIFYSVELKIPSRINDLYYTPYFGYIKQTGSIAQAFDLGDYLKGYREEKGNRLAAISLERRFKLFPGTDSFWLGLVKGAVTASIGDVLSRDENLSDFDLNSSFGAGIILPIGKYEIRADGVITDRGDWETLFSMSLAY